jgi:hypothetical protein
MANFASINSEFSDISDLDSYFEIRFVNAARVIDVTYTWICKASRASAFQYAQGADAGDQGAESYTAVSTDIAASAIASYMDVNVFVDAFEIEANEYGWTITDEGSTGTTNITLTEVPEVIPATYYGEKYGFNFAYGYTTNQYRVAIYAKNYASTITELTPGDNPFTYNIAGREEDIEASLMGGSGTFNFIASGSDVFNVYTPDFLDCTYKDNIVKLIKDPNGTPEIKWTGILLPANSYRDFQNYKYKFTIVANDAIADLKQQYYTESGKPWGVVRNGFEEILQIIKNAIGTVADAGDLQLDFRVLLNTYSNEMTSSENALKENEVTQELFYDDRNGDRKVDTCYEVLTKLLSPFDCNFMQWENVWWVLCKYERNSFYFEYDWDTLTQQSRTSFDRQFGSSYLEALSTGTLYKRQGKNLISTTLKNREYTAELLTNGQFASAVTGWDNGDAQAGADPWDDLEFYNYPGIGGTMSLQWAGAASSGSYKFSSSSTFKVNYGAGSGTITVMIAVERFSETPSGLSAPTVLIRLYNATDGYVNGTFGAKPISFVGGFQVFTETFDSVNDISAMDNYLDVTINVTDSSTTSVQFYIDYVTLSQVSNEVPQDWLYRSYLQSDDQRNVTEDEFYICEQQESSSDICAIKDVGGNFVTSWTRYLETESIPLIRVHHQYYANNEGRNNLDFATISIYDPDDEIKPYSMIYDTYTAKRYQIISFNKKYNSATVDIQLRQVYVRLGTNTDAAIYPLVARLHTQYGESI